MQAVWIYINVWSSSSVRRGRVPQWWWAVVKSLSDSSSLCVEWSSPDQRSAPEGPPGTWSRPASHQRCWSANAINDKYMEIRHTAKQWDIPKNIIKFPQWWWCEISVVRLSLIKIYIICMQTDKINKQTWGSGRALFNPQPWKIQPSFLRKL